MNKHIRFFVLCGVVLFSLACNINVTPTPTIAASPTPTLSLVVQVQNPTDIFDSIGDEIRYNYIVTNNSSAPLAGPVTVTDNIATVTCPELITIGNQNNTLDPGETITCSGTYRLTQAALDARSVANSAMVSAGGGSAVSAQSGITVNLTSFTPGKTLGLAKTAEPLTYNSVGQIITFKYVITNTGTLAIGPTQFMISDDRISGPFPCGTDPATTLNPGATLSCTANYTITPQDMGASSVTNTATASGGDAQPSAPANATITNSTFIPSVTPGASNLTPGSTIRHQVVKGEWLFQIARCYGVDYKSLRNANLQIPNPSVIDPGQVVTVPNIGSAGTIYGPPCVIYYTVAAGDTWNSIATRYNARLDVLQAVNPRGLVVGAQIKVPINSAGGTAIQVPVTGGATSTSTPTPTATPTATSILITPTFTATPTVSPTVTSLVMNTPTITATGTPPTPGTGQPARINIPAGSTSTMVSGSVISHETVSYVVYASQGQTMTVNLAANPSDIALRIQNPSGMLVKPLDGNLIWTGPIGATGDQRIDLVGLTDPTKNYSLTVTITSP